MKVVALISGGKDSCFNMMKCVDNGHKVVCLANLYPSEGDELDSYMYQTVGHNAVEVWAFLASSNYIYAFKFHQFFS